MITNGDSDDESEELNHIREKLQRNLNHGKRAQCIIHSDRSSVSSGDGNGSQEDKSERDTESCDDATVNFPRAKSKHWKADKSSTKKNPYNQNKSNTLVNVREASASWDDDDDDAFDAKLAAMNVLPVINKPNRDNSNPYCNKQRRGNDIARQIPSSSQSIQNSSRLNSIPSIQPIENEPSNKSVDAIESLKFSVFDGSNKENITPHLDDQYQPHDNCVINLSVQASESSKLSTIASCKDLAYEKHTSTVTKPKVASCEYEEANDQTNWYDEFESAESSQKKSIKSDGFIVDPFGFDEETEESPVCGEGNDCNQNYIMNDTVPTTRKNSSNTSSLKPIGSTIHESDVSKKEFKRENKDVNFMNHHSNSQVGDSYGLVEKPFDESLQPRELVDRLSEIDPSLYAPQGLDMIQVPIVHHFSLRNRPLNGRKTIPVNQIFSPPISLLWKNKFESFNQVQSEIANMLAYSDDNVVISAPTGAGKTAVFEMTIARFFAADLQATPPGLNELPIISKRRKIVYIAPNKALCEERFSDWSKRLSAMKIGIDIAVVTGDGDPSDALHDVAASHFILSTPEKWDSLTRRWTEKFYLFASVKLFLVDEVHLIADESRGCCLEAIVCRMKAIQRAAALVNVTEEEIAASSYSNTSPDAINSLLRFVAVSATLPNIADIAAFFEANEAHSFDESYRPVPLTTHVIGQGKLATDGKNGHFMFWKNLDRNVPELVIKYSNRRPSIVFCHSKADCEKLADLLATTHNIGQRVDATSAMACRTRVSKLQRVLIHGIAYHHAGLDIDDRRLVEESFLSGLIRVLCATSTLAMGVNLPAHLVIIKGTSAYRGTGEGGGYHDIDQASLLQMIGRAGRPSYDSSGTAIIMTDNDSKLKIEKLASSGLPPAKSQLIGSKLLETINIEISQRVINSVKSATDWIKGTLFYIQLMQDPEGYGIRVVSNYSIDAHILNICQTAVDRLRAIGVVATANGEDIYPLVACHIMSQRLVSFSAMTEISKIPYDSSHSQILKIVSMMDGMHFPVRRCEKKALNSIHKELKMYKLDGPLSKARVQEPWQKAFVLLQAYIEEFNVEGLDAATRQEMNSMVDCATRILSAIEELSLKGSMNGNILVQCLKIRRSLAVHLWSGKDGILRQIRGIGKALAFSLSMHGISTFADVLEHTEAQLEKAANRPPPFGSDLRKASENILRSRLLISANFEHGQSSMSPDNITCSLIVKSEQTGHTEFIDNSSSISYTLVAYTDEEGGIIFAKQNIVGPETFKCVLPNVSAPIQVQLLASIVGLDDSTLLDDTEKSLEPVRIASKNELTSKKRIRDPTISISGSNEYQRHGVKAARSTLNLHNKLAATQPSDGKSYSDRMLEAAQPPSVTPSPHLTPTNTESQKPRSNIMKSTLRVLPGHSIHPVIDNYPIYHEESQVQRYINTPTFHGTSNFSDHGLGSCVQSRHRSQISQPQSMSGVQSDSWKRLKYQQHKSQQRAFVRQSDNPFKNYKHDPNDTESYLDRLVSSSNETTPKSGSIIPPEGFLAIGTLRRPSDFVSRNAANESYTANSRGNFSRRKQQQSNAASICDILSQKAAESNVHYIMQAPDFHPYANHAQYSSQPSADFPPNVNYAQYPTQPYEHPLLHQTTSTHSLHRGNSQFMPQDYLVSYRDTGYSPNHNNIHNHLTDVNQYSHRNIDMYQTIPYTNIPASFGYIHSGHGKAQPQLQCDFRQISEKVASERRHEGVQYGTVDRENMEKAFF